MMRTLTRVWVALVLTGCGGEPSGPDASGVDAQAQVDSGPIAMPCARIADCDDGLYCNGPESCVDAVCVAGDPPCEATDTCDEAADECVRDECTGGSAMDGDLDDDGVRPNACGGDDCDDTDSTRFPGNTEQCNLDAPDHDEDCDPSTYGFRDLDMDGAADARCFNIRETDGMRFGGTDCDDNNSAISPLAAERCDGSIDEDCDGMVDEDCPCTPEGSVRACGSQVGECEGATEECTALGWSACGPAPATELCDGSRDEDCDATVDEGCACVSGTTRPCGVGACAVAQQTCVAGAWNATSCPSGSAETCNGIDDNCNGAIDDVPGLGDACGSSVGLCRPGVRSCVTGSAALVCAGPGYVAPAAEVCDHLNNDCDGSIDDGVHAAACTRTFPPSSGGLLNTPAYYCLPEATMCTGGLSGGASGPPLAAFTTWRGDFGRSNLFRARVSLRDTSADGNPPDGWVTFWITTDRALGSDATGPGPFGSIHGIPLAPAASSRGILVSLHGQSSAVFALAWNGASWSELGPGGAREPNR